MSDLTQDSFWEILKAIPETKAIFYRLYYDNEGLPVVYSMEELPHSYVDIDVDTFWKADMSVRVVDGKLIFKRPSVSINKLQPAEYGTACDPRDVCVVVSADSPNQRWTIVENEIN